MNNDQYNRVMRGITIIPLTCIGIALMFALIYFIYNILYLHLVAL